MPVYAYGGLNTQGKNASGVIDAESEKAARLKLRKIGLFPTEVGLEGAKGVGGLRLGGEIDFAKYFQRIKAQDLATMTRQLSTLISAQIPLVDSLTALTDQVTNVKLRNVVSSVKEGVVQGQRFSEALAAHPKVFSGLFIHMIAACEASGAMEVVLERLPPPPGKEGPLPGRRPPGPPHPPP